MLNSEKGRREGLFLTMRRQTYGERERVGLWARGLCGEKKGGEMRQCGRPHPLLGPQGRVEERDALSTAKRRGEGGPEVAR